MNQSCVQCGSDFDITDEDLVFYEEISPTFNGKKILLPPPTKCPDCRYRQRLTWRNERNLYRNTCQATGKSILSVFSSDKEWPPVYDQAYWWSDKWDAKDYGRDFDFSRPFFDQWIDLFKATPQLAMNNQMSENCDYTNQSQRNKDCYLIFCSNDSRDSYHGMWYQKCKNCVDSVYLEESELCYEILNGKNCYRCIFSQNIENCSDVSFSRNLIGCKNCIGCVNLRNKEYRIFNEQYSKEEYETKVRRMNLHTYEGIRQTKEQAEKLFESAPRKYYVGAQGEDFSGDYILNVRDSLNCFNCRDTEHMRHCQDVWRAQNCQDMTETVENDFSYSIEGCGPTSGSLFCKKSFDLNNSFYCSHSNMSHDLFGCISLNHAQYCILNKQYTKEKYEELVPKILEHMQKIGEWGHHFPAEGSPYGYNESVAQEYFPLRREEVLKRGWKWRDVEDPMQQAERTIDAPELPGTIGDVPDDIINWAIRCEVTGKLFRIIKQELDFYRMMDLPIPHIHHDERYRRRMALRNPRQLWNRECMDCQKSIETTYSPDRPEIVYCEECYLASVY